MRLVPVKSIAVEAEEPGVTPAVFTAWLSRTGRTWVCLKRDNKTSKFNSLTHYHHIQYDIYAWRRHCTWIFLISNTSFTHKIKSFVPGPSKEQTKARQSCSLINTKYTFRQTWTVKVLNEWRNCFISRLYTTITHDLRRFTHFLTKKLKSCPYPHCRRTR